MKVCSFQKASLVFRALFGIIFFGICQISLLNNPAMCAEEAPIKLPKTEGSRSFDLEINQFNNQGIEFYYKRQFKKATMKFKQALKLAQQLRDPSRGIVFFNLALSLHESGSHGEAAQHFIQARRFSRGNLRIQESELLKNYECGFNPSVPCNNKIPLPMNIEGSH